MVATIAGEAAMSPLPEYGLLIAPVAPIVGALALCRPRTLYFWGTTVFGLIAYVVSSLAALLALVAFLAWHDAWPSDSPDDIQMLWDGGWTDLASIVASPFMLAVVLGAIRLTRQPFADYLALNWPGRRALARGLAMMAGLLLAWFLVGYFTGQKAPPSLVDSYNSARVTGWLPAYLFALCIAAPLTEELLVRGFLYRGWSESFLRPAGAIVLSSAVWAAAHVQYELFFLGQVFTVGLLLGYLRYRTNSTWLTIVLHGLNNLVSVLAIMWLAGT